jgi:glyoxylase I family protein
MMRWSHAALNARDIEETERFYTQWFGFERVNAFDVGEMRIVFLRLGDAYLELFSEAAVAAPIEGGPDGPAAAGAVRHLAFQTSDVDEQLRRMGPEARITLGPIGFDAFIPGWRSVWLRDPDGVIVEVSQGYRDHPGHDHAGHDHAGGRDG